MDLVWGDVVSGAIAFTGFWELGFTRRLVSVARQGGSFVDVGANLGYFSLLWAATNKGNHSFAFEASPRNADLLLHNVRKNECGSRITVALVAAGRAPGRMDFDPGSPDQTGWGGLAVQRTDRSVAVDVVRLDEALDNSGRIALLKIDVEGADTWVLMGCEKLLSRRRINEIWFEENRPRMRALGIGEREALTFLRGVGYVTTPHYDRAGNVVSWSAVPS